MIKEKYRITPKGIIASTLLQCDLNYDKVKELTNAIEKVLLKRLESHVLININNELHFAELPEEVNGKKTVEAINND